MTLRKHKNKIIILGVFIIICVIFALIYYFTSGNGGGGGKNTTSVLDNSDCPIPPTTLQYDSTYQAPKRNCNITYGGSGPTVVEIYEDSDNGTYTLPADEIDYKL